MKKLITALVLSLPFLGCAQSADKMASDTKASADKAGADASSAASTTKKSAKHNAKKASNATKAAGDELAK